MHIELKEPNPKPKKREKNNNYDEKYTYCVNLPICIV